MTLGCQGPASTWGPPHLVSITHLGTSPGISTGTQHPFGDIPWHLYWDPAPILGSSTHFWMSLHHPCSPCPPCPLPVLCRLFALGHLMEPAPKTVIVEVKVGACWGHRDMGTQPPVPPSLTTPCPFRHLMMSSSTKCPCPHQRRPGSSPSTTTCPRSSGSCQLPGWSGDIHGHGLVPSPCPLPFPAWGHGR